MIRRSVLILLEVLPCLLLLGLLACGPTTAWAQQPTRLPTVIRMRFDEPRPGQSPAKPPQAASAEQATQFSQPEYPQTSAVFSGPVSWEVLARYALAGNPEIQAARYQARALGARVPQAASLGDPQLMTTVFLESIQTAAGPQEVAMSLSQKFPWFGKRQLRSRVAYHEAMAAYARATAVELKVIETLQRAYFDLYFLQHAMEVTRALQPRLKDVIDITKTKYENNQLGLESVYQAQIELSNLKTRLVELQQAQVAAQARLAGVLHLPPHTQIEAEAKLDRAKVAHTARLLVDLAESYQPELTARNREVNRDQASVALARRDYWPDVTVGLNWYEIGSAGLSPIATGEDAFSLGVGVNLPLYRKRLDAAVREAQYKTARSARQYAATRDQVRAEVLALYAQFVQHDQVFEILQSEIVPRAERTLELSIEAYRVGDLEFQQLIDSYASLLKFRIEYYRREAVREQVIASLRRAVGCAITAM